VQEPLFRVGIDLQKNTLRLSDAWCTPNVAVMKNTALLILLFLAAGAVQAQTAGTITFRANATSATGSMTPVLTWSTSPSANRCTASGGWSGTKAASGTQTLTSINVTTNYTLTCTWGMGSATVQWTPPTTNTDGTRLSNLAAYRVFYGTSTSALTQVNEVTDTSATTATINSLSPATWYFKVRAVNSNQVESSDSNVSSKVIPSASAAKSVQITITGSSPPPPTGNEVEPNASVGQAQLISTTGTTINGTMSASSDYDFYRVSLPAGKKLTATMTPNSSSDYELYLFNSSGTAIGWSENGKGVAETVSITNSNSSAVSYYVRVSYYAGGTGTTNGKYTIRFGW
jgi:hypothetical protein